MQLFGFRHLASVPSIVMVVKHSYISGLPFVMLVTQ